MDGILAVYGMPLPATDPVATSPLPDPDATGADPTEAVIGVFNTPGGFSGPSCARVSAITCTKPSQKTEALKWCWFQLCSLPYPTVEYFPWSFRRNNFLVANCRLKDMWMAWHNSALGPGNHNSTLGPFT